MLVGRKTCTAVLGDTSRVLGVVPFVLLLILLLLVVLLLVLFFRKSVDRHRCLGSLLFRRVDPNSLWIESEKVLDTA